MIALPIPPLEYNAINEARRNEALKKADLENHKKTTDVEVGTERRVILTAPNGNRYAFGVDNTGALVGTLL